MELRSRVLVLILAVACAVLLIACSNSADGDSLVKAECDRCHSFDYINNSANVTADEWEQTIRQMEARGLQITTDERVLIVEYLAGQNISR